MIVTTQSHPALTMAIRAIEYDNGGHLIGTVYPGEPMNLDQFDVPNAYEHLIAPAEAGLSRLRQDYGDKGDEVLEDFVIGEEEDVNRLAQARGDLNEAQQLLNAYFDGWPA